MSSRPRLTHQERRAAGVTTIKVSWPTRELLDELLRGQRIPLTLDDLVYELAVAELERRDRRAVYQRSPVYREPLEAPETADGAE